MLRIQNQMIPRHLAPARPLLPPGTQLGQSSISSSSVWPFIGGMVAYAFFGDVIKKALGIGAHAAHAGLSKVERRLPPRVKESKRKRNDPPYLLPGERIQGEVSVGVSPGRVTPRIVGDDKSIRAWAKKMGVCTECLQKQASPNGGPCPECRGA